MNSLKKLTALTLILAAITTSINCYNIKIINAIDKNGDNIIQYIMLKGNAESLTTIARTKYSIETINNAGIQTEEIAAINSN